MLWFIITGIAVLIVGVCLVVALDPESRLGAFGVGAAVGLGWIIFTVFMTFATVPAGHVGLVREFNDYVGTMSPGVNMKVPWQSVEDANVRVQSKKVYMDGTNGTGSAVSAETQPVFAVVTLNFSVRPDCVVDLYRTVGGRYFDSIVEPRVQQVFKAQTVEYRTIEVAPSREEIRVQVQGTLDAQLDRFCIDVEDFLINNLDFADEFSKAIERKQVATQDALAAQEKVRQAEAEARQRIAQAEGEAEALRLKAQAIRDNPELIQLTMVERLSDKVQVILVPQGGNFLFDTKGMLAPQPQP